MVVVPIPIGVRRVRELRGTARKTVVCEQCQERYAYLLELSATGDDYDILFLDAAGSAKRAHAQAEESFARLSQNVVLPVPCPTCGHYQNDMAKRLTEGASINWIQIVGAVVAATALLLLAVTRTDYGAVAIALGIVGLAVLACGYVVSFRFDPNAGDPAERIAVGQQHAIWGEQLDELLRLEAEGRSESMPPRDHVDTIPGESGGKE